jgi:hypothetical protein
VGKVYVILQPLDVDDSEDEEEMGEVTIEQLRGLAKAIVPASFMAKLEQVRKELNEASLGSDNDGGGFRMTNTASSYAGHAAPRADAQGRGPRGGGAPERQPLRRPALGAGHHTGRRGGRLLVRRRRGSAPPPTHTRAHVRSLRGPPPLDAQTDAPEAVLKVAQRLFRAWGAALKEDDAELDVGPQDRAGFEFLPNRFKEEVEGAGCEVPRVPKCGGGGGGPPGQGLAQRRRID